MPRKGPAPKRPVVIDPVFQSQLVTQLVNKILLDGKKSTADKRTPSSMPGTSARMPATSSRRKRVRLAREPPKSPSRVLAERNSCPR